MKKEKLIEEDYPLVKQRYKEFDKSDVSIIHRKYPDVGWEYRAVVFHLEGSNIIYYVVIEKNVKTKGIEVYSGRNYVVGSSRNSYSRRYDVNDVPAKYKKYVKYLKSIHSKIEWSKREHVDVEYDFMQQDLQ